MIPDVVRYREIRPARHLRSVIDTYWTLQHDGRDSTAQRVVPDGHPELILNLGQPFQALSTGQWQSQPRMFLAGQIDGPLVLRPQGASNIIGIRFQAHGAAALFGHPMNDLAGRFTPVDDLAPSLSRRLESILDSPNPIAQLDEELSRSTNPNPDDRIEAAVQRITHTRAQTDLAALARDLGLSLRQFERRFNHNVGLPPKLYCRLQRFVQIFRTGLPSKWADTAIGCGYYDQSHLIRDFKQFTGETPAVLMAEDADLAHHFLERFGVSHSSNTRHGTSV